MKKSERHHQFDEDFDEMVNMWASGDPEARHSVIEWHNNYPDKDAAEEILKLVKIAAAKRQLQ
jgi:hypothetical protein